MKPMCEGTTIWVGDLEDEYFKVQPGQTKTIAFILAEMLQIPVVSDFDLATAPLTFTMYVVGRNGNPFHGC